MHLDIYGHMSHPSEWYFILLAGIVYFWDVNPYTPAEWPVELWSLVCSRGAWFDILLYLYSMQGMWRKVLSMENGQFVGEALSVSPQKFKNH